MTDLQSSGGNVGNRGSQPPVSSTSPVLGGFPDSVGLGIFFGIVLDALTVVVFFAGGLQSLFYVFYFGAFQFVVLIPCILWSVYARKARLVRGFLIVAATVFILNIGAYALLLRTRR